MQAESQNSASAVLEIDHWIHSSEQVLPKLGQVHFSIVALFVTLLQQTSPGSCQKDTIYWGQIVNSVHLSLCWYSLQHAKSSCDTHCHVHEHV